jgi:TonB family protein
MEPNRSTLALLIALAFHTVLILFIWSTTRNPADEMRVENEKKFGILLNDKVRETDPPYSEKRLNTPIFNRNFQKEAPAVELKPLTQADRNELPYSVLHHYGDQFFELSAGEQHYIIDNLQRIRKINEVVGTRLLRERSDVDPMDNNVVEFILNPDGSISDLTLEKNRIGTALDELTLQTINLAHPKYPKPEQPTRVRIRVYIIVK